LIEIERFAELPQVLPAFTQLEQHCRFVRPQSRGFLEPLDRPAEVSRPLQPLRELEAHSPIRRQSLDPGTQQVDGQPIVFFLQPVHELLRSSMTMACRPLASNRQPLFASLQPYLLAQRQERQIAARRDLRLRSQVHAGGIITYGSP